MTHKNSSSVADYVQPICLPYGCNIEYTIEQIMVAGHYYQVGWQIYQPNRSKFTPFLHNSSEPRINLAVLLLLFATANTVLMLDGVCP